VPILDHRGNPIEREKLKERGGQVRSLPEKVDWQRTVAPGIDPSLLAGILRANDSGDNLDMLTLAHEMPERDLNYFSKLQQRSNAVTHVPIRMEPRDKSANAAKIAEACQENVIDTPQFRWFLSDLMDALGVGYSVVQPIWETNGRPWTFSAFEHFDPRAFQFDTETGKELRVRKKGHQSGLPLPSELLVHYPRIRTGVKLRGGLARLAAVNWLFKTCTVTDWLAFAEVYGMPIRLGIYDPNTATEDELATLHTALVNLGHDAAAMIPKSMKIEFVDARRPTSGDNLYKGLADYFDGQLTMAVMGQVLALDARATGLGQAVADLHTAVRQDIREADALALRATVEPLIRMWTELSYGIGAPVPKLVIDIRPPLDIQKFTQGILPWMQHAGLEVPLKWLHDQLQVPIPEDGEITLKAPLAPGTPGSGAPVPGLKST